IFFLSIPLALNLFVLGYLIRIVTQSVETIQEVSARQQAVALRMQAQLHDAEAALYRYQIEGEAAYVEQFERLMGGFEHAISNFETLAISDQEQLWADELSVAHQEATALGSNLIALTDAQASDLAQRVRFQSP
ncbi:MAG: hypothetical protein R3264_15930, partial [Anaerolineae bacterium]|nr:hypothetical protein [Anaerolineae bacterium]